MLIQQEIEQDFRECNGLPKIKLELETSISISTILDSESFPWNSHTIWILHIMNEDTLLWA